jgi:hypothetical protein
MAVYLGSAGIIQLSRTSLEVFRSTMDPGDVDVAAKRFSFDFPSGTFVTGDRLAIARLNADGSLSDQPLDFAGTLFPDGLWYAHVDPLGGIRLYNDWADALEGAVGKAVALQTPASTYDISVKLEDGLPHCLGQIASYTVSTERAAIDVTSLGDSFVEQISGLISGGGSIRCFWDWRPSVCGGAGTSQEMPHYLHQLILRQQLGSEFKASLFIKQDGASPINDELPQLASRTALFYEVTGLITSVGLSFESAEALQSEIEFVTTGEIALRYQQPAANLILQEDRGRLALEDQSGDLAQELAA